MPTNTEGAVALADTSGRNVSGEAPVLLTASFSRFGCNSCRPLELAFGAVVRTRDGVGVGTPVLALRRLDLRGERSESIQRHPGSCATWRRQVPLELLRYAGVNRLKVDIDYRAEKGRQGRAGSSRTPFDGNLVLFVVNDCGALRSYRVDRIAGIRPTAVPFTPRFRVEF